LILPNEHIEVEDDNAKGNVIKDKKTGKIFNMHEGNDKGIITSNDSDMVKF